MILFMGTYRSNMYHIYFFEGRILTGKCRKTTGAVLLAAHVAKYLNGIITHYLSGQIT